MLRVRTRKGMIVQLFCTTEEELGLAERMIEEFKTSWKNRERKSEIGRASCRERVCLYV